jgi:glycosyltransferase involved in cell wall biosynthesis
MSRVPHIYFAVTNDLTYDRRMHRICGSLQAAGFRVTLVGRQLPSSSPIEPRAFRQIRLHCLLTKGKFFYLEYNIRLFFCLLFRRMDAVCAIDLDAIIPCYLVSLIRRIPRVYDAHELFCEMKEVAERPAIHKVWKWIERKMVPRFPRGYTVNHLIAREYKEMYGLDYTVIRNMPPASPLSNGAVHERFILYQGAVNEGRCFEQLIPAMKQVNAGLMICGDGNFMEQARDLVKQHGLESKVTFKGMVSPAQLAGITRKARVGITLFEKKSKSNYYSLANRFFDYIQAGVPQLCVDYPLYREIQQRHEIGILIPEVSEEAIIHSLNSLLQDDILWERLHQNCLEASKEFNWQREEKKLIDFYGNIFGKASSHHQS